MRLKRWSRSAAASLLLLMEAGASAQTGTHCEVEEGVVDIWGAPLPVEPVASGQVVAAKPNAILAQETLQIATRMWRTREALELPGESFVYPAGVRVTALMSPRGEEKCLRDATRPGTGIRGGEIVPCLSDADGDGRFEVAESFRLNTLVPFEGTKPQFRPLKHWTLASPVDLSEDSQGVDNSRMRILRRIRVVAIAAERIDVIAESATQHAPASISYSMTGGGIAPVPRGPIDFEPLGPPRSFVLRDGAVERIGGIRFRLEKAGSGWLLTPLDRAFPEWLAYKCGGTQVVTRAIPL